MNGELDILKRIKTFVNAYSHFSEEIKRKLEEKEDEIKRKLESQNRGK